MGTHTIEEGQSQNYTFHHQPSTVWKVGGIVLRLMVTAFSIAALVLMARNKDVATTSIGGVVIYVPAKYSYVKAFVYLVYANGIAAIYCFFVALAFLFSLIRNSGHRTALAWLLFLLDQVVTYVLLAAAAASTDTAYIAKKGNSKVGWSEVCNSIGHFCHVATASLATTFASLLILAILSAMSAYNLSRRRGHAK